MKVLNFQPEDDKARPAVTRRRFLCSAVTTGAAGAGAAMLAAQPARALSLETMSAPTATAFAQRCSVDPLHAELIAQLKADLKTDAEHAALARIENEALPMMRCPVCGCPITAALEPLDTLSTGPKRAE